MFRITISLVGLYVFARIVWFGFVFGIATIWCFRQSKRTTIVNEASNPKTSEQVAISQSWKIKIISFIDGVSRYAILLTGKIPSFHIRNLLYRRVFRMRINKNTIIYGGCEFRNPYNITIGRSVIGPNCICDGRCRIDIGDNVCLGSGVKIWTMQHDIQSPTFCSIGAPVVIEDYAWVASFATVLPGKTLGKGCVVSSNAVVTKNCDPYAVYAGVPAIKKEDRTHTLNYTLNSHWGLF